MILRLTNTLTKKIKAVVSEDDGRKISAFEEWYGHSFTVDKHHYILFTNAYSLYSTIILGNGINNLVLFIDATTQGLYEALKSDGYGNLTSRFVARSVDSIRVCKTANRAIIGSMNDIISQTKFYLTEYQMPISEITRRINTMPFSYLKYKNPLDILKQMPLS